MMVGNISLWRVLERRSAPVFLVASGLLLVSVGIEVVAAITAMATEGSFLWVLFGLTSFGGLVLTFIGMLGLYPGLATGAPLLARSGILLIALPTISFAVLFVWVILGTFLEFSVMPGTFLPLDIINGVCYLLIAIGVAIFGIVSLRGNVHSRAVGGLLLVFAGVWVVYLGAIPVFGFPIPTWFFVVWTGVLAGSLFGIGYFVWTDPHSSSTTGTSG